MTRVWTPLIAILLALGQVACVTSQTSIHGNNSTDDEEILRALLTPLIESANSKYLVVASKPSAPELEQGWIKAHLDDAGIIERPTDLAHMLSSYNVRNSRERLPQNLNHVKIVESATLSKMFAGDVIGGWKRFRAGFPGADALVDLSLPGYSSERKWAIACYSVARGSLAGEVWVALLHKENSTWAVRWREILFQS